MYLKGVRRLTYEDEEVNVVVVVVVVVLNEDFAQKIYLWTM